MLYVKFQWTAKLNDSNIAAFEDAELPINKIPKTDEELLDLEEQLRRIIYKIHKTTAFENLKFESVKWKLI